MKKFIGRKNELSVLEDSYLLKQSAFIPIYGRRRVGKSELIFQFLKNKKGIYFTGKRAQAGLQIKEFLQEAAIVLDEPLLADLNNQDWKQVLEKVVSRWRGKNKLILVFDEFQWTAEASPELPSVLQALWDRTWKKSGKVMLILCGSYIGFMEREVLGRKSPLFGRRTAQIFLKAFGYLEASEFHHAYSEVDRARAYFICGGIPWYLNFFSDHRSIEKNISETLLNPYSPLFQEPEFLLREELRDVNTYYAILMTIASGISTHLGISKNIQMDNRAIHYYLNQLTGLGYVSRQYPLTTGRPSKRDVRYVLSDPLLRFWFRFVYPNTSYIIQAGGGSALKNRIAGNLEAYFGYCFERLCREALPMIYKKDGIDVSFNVGKYWNKQTQIDVVGIRDDNWIDLGECKWGRLGSVKKVEKELETKKQNYPNPDNYTISNYLFCRYSVPKNASQNIRWLNLKDLYQL